MTTGADGGTGSTAPTARLVPAVAADFEASCLEGLAGAGQLVARDRRSEQIGLTLPIRADRPKGPGERLPGKEC